MKISIIGAGYVGLSLAILLSQKNEVTIADRDETKIKMINKKVSPIRENDIIKAFGENKNTIIATSSVKESLIDADFIIIAVSTDFNIEMNQFDVHNIEDIIKTANEVNNNATVVIKSTIPIGFINKICYKFNSPSNLLYCPEFLREGRSLHDNLYPSRIIIGIKPDDPQNVEKASAFADILKENILVDNVQVLFMGYSEAEAVKLFSNAFLALRVAFFNELDTFAESKSLNSKDIIEGVCLDSRIGMFYNNPSFGYGGYCLPKDTKQLLADFNMIPHDIISSIVSSNVKRKEYIVHRIMSLSDRIKLKQSKKNIVIGVYRLIMKSHSANCRYSSVIDIIDELLKLKYSVVVYEPSKMTMGEYVDEWLAAMRPNLARTTYQTYKSANKRFVEYLDVHYPGITLGELRHNHVQEFLNHKLGEGCKGSAAKQYYLAIHSCLAYAIKMEYITTHPMDKLVVPRADKYEATFYNKEELNKLFEVFKGDRLELVVHIAAYYGLRRSEVLGLRWDAVDFVNKTISIQRKVVSDYDEDGHRKLYVENRLKTNSTRRTLPLIPHIEKMLLEKKELETHFKKVCGKSYDTEFEGFICRDNYGKLISPEYVTSRFHYVITKNGLRHLRFHDLRHSCASLLLANDVPMKAIQEWLGHSNYSITANLYSHLEYNAKVISAETIARVLDGEAEQQSNTPAENIEPAPEKKSTKKTAGKKPSAKKTSDKKSASDKSTTTTETPAPKKSGGRKKKSETPTATGESQISRV